LTAEQPSTAYWFDWLPIVLLVVGVLLLAPADWSGGTIMSALVLAQLAGFKWLTWRGCATVGVPCWRQAAYLLAWPGFDAPAFLGTINHSRVPRPPAREWAGAAGNVACGVTLCWGVGRLIPPSEEMLFGWIGMLGLLLILHCGLFRMVSCGWRWLGIDARPLMNRPLLSASVRDFWGKRWNTAFRDLTHRFVFVPLTRTLGPRWAVAAGFAFSGILHELAISVPARGGYGGPSLYFLIQALAWFMERSRWGRALGLGRGLRGWLFAMVVVMAPACLLFHPPFIHNVVVPFMRRSGMGV
jgi:alginate O-acetyltransferase complex protein AlgI